MVQGCKVGGAAQRRVKQGILHQASICLTLPTKDYLEQVLSENSVIEQMYANSFPLLGPQATPEHVQEARSRLHRDLDQALHNC